MIRSEIDEIFASQGRHGSSTVAPSKKKNKKDKKRKREVDDEHIGHEKKQPEPETVVDPSSSHPTPAAKAPAVVAPKAKKKKRQNGREDLAQFKDSRGTGPRRKTEEGFAIYKETELGIDAEAGGTPSCPFNCDCCF